MNRKDLEKIAIINLIIFCCIFLSSNLLLGDTITPASINATLGAGGCLSEIKTITLSEGGIPKEVDIMFSFDLTATMFGVLLMAQMNANDIMTRVQEALPGSTIRFGVVSYMDYPHSYSPEENCNYSDNGQSISYGFENIDYAYRLDQELTTDTEAVSVAINNLMIASGGDHPQDYTRIFYESYADSSIDWGNGVKIWINFGDDVPHDCNLNEGVPGKLESDIWSTGIDPGRNEVMGDEDDLDLQVVLAGMAANNIILMQLYYADAYADEDQKYKEYWDFWTGITGGATFIITDFFPQDLPAKILEAVEKSVKPHINSLTLRASAGYEDWLVSVEPAEYTDIVIPAEGQSFDFEIIICVPQGIKCGLYEFDIEAVKNGVLFLKQDVAINVEGGTFRITPRTINKCRNGNWVTGHITPPPGYTRSDIVSASIVSINGVPVDIEGIIKGHHCGEEGEHDNNDDDDDDDDDDDENCNEHCYGEGSKAVVKFSSAEVIKYLPDPDDGPAGKGKPGRIEDVEICIIVQLADGQVTCVLCDYPDVIEEGCGDHEECGEHEECGDNDDNRNKDDNRGKDGDRGKDR